MWGVTSKSIWLLSGSEEHDLFEMLASKSVYQPRADLNRLNRTIFVTIFMDHLVKRHSKDLRIAMKT